MSQWNDVSFEGRLGQDPESRYTNGSGKQMVSARIAVNDGKDRPPIWIKMITMQQSVIDKLMERSKGDLVRAVGSLCQPDAYISKIDNQPRCSLSMWLDDITYMQWDENERKFSQATETPKVPTVQANVPPSVKPAGASEPEQDYDSIPF